ncbi:MAG: SPOR domain-containing protein [Methylococcales bacterium]|nr:SPOR domain-containing protein [Methylococcales bacterium]MCK5924475.1 SPOR domain-containing protein [Methylococcales bacterium]
MKIEEWLQNRIIGAIVITLLAVIFLPMFLDDAEESLQETETLVLPEESLVNTMGLSTTELPDNVDDVIENLHAQPPEETTEPLPPAATTVPVPNPSTVAVPTTVVTVPTPAPVAVEKKSTTIKRWYVQAASFHREDNAYTLTEKLKSQGFSAAVDVSTSSSGTSIYRVRVAQVDRQTAKSAKAKINQLNRLKSIIIFSN